MKLIKQSHEILALSDNILENIERAGRTCYQSFDKVTEDSSEKFARMIIKHGHEAMIEFGDITVRFITNRGVTHELVRHRLCSFAQESTRYVRYHDVEFIEPVWGSHPEFIRACRDSEAYYRALIDEGWKPQQAREVLNNAAKTEIVVKASIREWRHIFKLRTSARAHPQIRELMKGLLKDLKKLVPVVFEDL